MHLSKSFYKSTHIRYSSGLSGSKRTENKYPLSYSSVRKGDSVWFQSTWLLTLCINGLNSTPRSLALTPTPDKIEEVTVTNPETVVTMMLVYF